MSDDVPEHLRPRLCHVAKAKDFQGYGFNLHAEKGKAGQFIGKIDESSPAEAAGLREGDRIVEVNGVNIGNENHQQVVTRIKSGGDETRLLVVDVETDNWYKENKKIIRGDLAEVKFISSKRDEDDNHSAHGRLTDTYEDSHSEKDIEEIPAVTMPAPVYNGNSVDEDQFHKPRLCHLKTWPHFQGYGFNLHAERDKPGQYIGLVDEDSPASSAGLRVQDRIIEVNGVNVEKEKHPEVIARIKAIPGEVKLLVADRKTDNYYKEKGVTMSSSMQQTDYIATKEHIDENVKKTEGTTELEPSVDVVPEPDSNDLHDAQAEPEQPEMERLNVEENLVEDDEIKAEVVEEEERTADEHVSDASSTQEDDGLNVEDTANGRQSFAKPQSSEPEHEFTVAPQPQVRQEPATASAGVPKGSEGLELNLSVAEMKERLKANKRQDPRLNKISFEQKYKEFQRM